MDIIRNLLDREPAAFYGVINAAIALAVGFGLNWTTEQVGLVLAFTSAILAFVTRQSVVPVGKLPDKVVEDAARS